MQPAVCPFHPFSTTEPQPLLPPRPTHQCFHDRYLEQPPEGAPDIEAAHQAAAAEGDSAPPADDEEVSLHFVTFVHKAGAGCGCLSLSHCLGLKRSARYLKLCTFLLPLPDPCAYLHMSPTLLCTPHPHIIIVFRAASLQRLHAHTPTSCAFPCDF